MGKMDRQYHATQSQASLIPGEDGNAVCLCVFLFVVSIFYKHSSGGGMKKKEKILRHQCNTSRSLLGSVRKNQKEKNEKERNFLLLVPVPFR